VAAIVVWATAGTRAETYGEKVKAVDAVKGTITVGVEGMDRTFNVEEKVDVQAPVRAGQRLRQVAAHGSKNGSGRQRL